MTKLPVLSGQGVVKALLKKRFVVHHQRGSHIILKQESPLLMLTENRSFLDTRR